jgi:V/A-type H+-transporting ATPase subunit I
MSMIIKMAKVEIVGPKHLLLAVLDLLRGKAVFHPEADIHGFVPPEDEAKIRELLLDETAVGEKLFFLRLRDRIQELLAALPDLQVRASYLQPLPIVDVIEALAPRHLEFCHNWTRQRQSLQEQAETLNRHFEFWTALEPLVAEVPESSRLAFFGVRIRDPNQVPVLSRLLEERAAGRCRLATASVSDGSRVGLIITDRGMEKLLRQLLTAEQVPELSLPADLARLPFREKSTALRQRLAEISAQLDRLTGEMETFARRWLPIYRQFLDWLEERIALYQATAAAYETRQCFFIHGWMANSEVPAVAAALREDFSGQVLLHLLEVRREDLERVPVLLKNPLYFKPFELLSRLLPVPRYSSYDPTPFLGVFFPLLFGMMLGDIGYGGLLAILAALLIYFCPQRRNLRDGAKILGVCAAYTMLFGFLFGELFGDLGGRFFQLQPLWMERSQALGPMICFAVSVGAGHILLGLGLGIRTDWKMKKRRAALVKICNLLLIGMLALWGAGRLLPDPWELTRPLLLSLLVLIPLLIFVGGLLAPLELLKNLGNIISYVRIMAIGLASVLLAEVANQLGGMTGEVVAGVLVAGVLHFFNLVLGVFAPTVHALRLHYVEFFSKFLEFGGRQFAPLKRKK